MSMMVSICAVLFPRGVLDEILNLIESVSEVFPLLFCFGSLLISGVARCYLWLFTLYINIKIGKKIVVKC